METPSSERRMSRTPPFGPVNSASKQGNVLASAKKSRGGSRRALLDVTNDSPIVGLALERNEWTESPASSTKRCPLPESLETPGTGEALLRYQVKSLLQRVEADSIKPPSSLRTLCHLNGFLASPSRLLAPTPANTPDATVVYNAFATDSSCLLTSKSDHTMELYVDLGMLSPASETKMESPGSLSEENSPLPEVIDVVKLIKVISPEKPITRALLFDSPEKTDPDTSVSSPSSVISSEDSPKVRNMEDDDVSEWSVQVNISSPGPEQADEYVQGENDVEEQVNDVYEEDENNEDQDEDDEQEEGEVIEEHECEELCQGLSRVSMHDSNGGCRQTVPAFAGKHTRFVYNSDDEFEEEVVSELPSPNLVRLKGMPTPKGKHFRFPEDDDDSGNASH
eukprot:Gb_14634 [translate_table: standard]